MTTAVRGDVKSAKRAKRGRAKRPEAAPASRGLVPPQLASATPPPAVTDVSRAIEKDGGWVLCAFRDPLGGHWHVLAGLPLERVVPTPFQRDLSASHVARLADVIDRMDRFLDPIVAVRQDGGVYWTPNGHHRTAALRALGARSVLALVLPDANVAYRILAMNTEKAHNLKEKSLEVIRMARSLAEVDPRPEREFALEFEQAAYLTLGACYERRSRFAGGVYHPVLRRVDGFLAAALPKAIQTREERAAKLLEVDDAVREAVRALADRGFRSPYLKAYVVARVNPLRFQRGARAGFDETLEKMLVKAKRFDADRVRADQLATASGPPED